MLSSSFPVMTAKFITFPDEQIANVPPLEPALEGLLRAQNMHDEVIMAFRCNDVLPRSVFFALDPTEEGLTKSAAAFEIRVESGEFVHKREMTKLITAWQQGKIEHDTKLIDAVSRAHGEPVSMLTSTNEVATLKKRRAALERAQNRPSKSQRGNQSYDGGARQQRTWQGKRQAKQHFQGNERRQRRQERKKRKFVPAERQRVFQKIRRNLQDGRKKTLSRQRPRAPLSSVTGSNVTLATTQPVHACTSVWSVARPELHTTIAAVSMPSYDKQLCSMKNMLPLRLLFLLHG